jgi:hypothetical protein
MLLQAAYHRREYAAIEERTRAVMFLATPHDGAAIARIARLYGFRRPAPILTDLMDNSAALLDLSHGETTTRKRWSIECSTRQSRHGHYA